MVADDALCSVLNPPSALPSAFFERDTVQVAQELLGHLLILYDPGSSLYVPYRIVETEAYTDEDPACHAYGRRHGRAETLYKQAGLAYVYFIYGMYFCLNVVAKTEGRAGAVLFRAVEPLHADYRILKTHGPGRLTKALGITKALHNEVLLTSPDSPLFLAQGQKTDKMSIITTTRIGIRKAADYPWRFYIRDNPYVSVK